MQLQFKLSSVKKDAPMTPYDTNFFQVFLNHLIAVCGKQTYIYITKLKLLNQLGFNQLFIQLFMCFISFKPSLLQS